MHGLEIKHVNGLEIYTQNISKNEWFRNQTR